MTAKEFLETTYDEKNEWQVRPRALCYDGYNISIQGGTRGHYCNPRKKTNEYIAVELGYPSELDELLEEYAEDHGTCQTVFAYVPIGIVEALVSKHGGIKGGQPNSL